MSTKYVPYILTEVKNSFVIISFNKILYSLVSLGSFELHNNKNLEGSKVITLKR